MYLRKYLDAPPIPSYANLWAFISELRDTALAENEEVGEMTKVWIVACVVLLLATTACAWADGVEVLTARRWASCWAATSFSRTAIALRS